MTYARQYPPINDVRAPDVEIHLDGDFLYELRPYLLFVAGGFIALSLLMMLLN